MAERRAHPYFRHYVVFIFSIVIYAVTPLSAEVQVADVFGENMVLQREMPVPVWGTADPGEAVTVSLNGSNQQTNADQSGHWKVILSSMDAGGPYQLEIRGTNTLRLDNVLIGEVWICSGQSNMEWSVRNTRNAVQVIPRADHPEIRLFTTRHRPSGLPLADLDAGWMVCDTGSVRDFTAVGYFFGAELHEVLDVPVGLINTTWGGTRIEPWTPPAGFDAVSELSEISELIARSNDEYVTALHSLLPKWVGWTDQVIDTGVRSNLPVPPEALPEHALADRAQPSGLYNGMVYPLIPFAFRGAIWYQGEANRGDEFGYLPKMKALIRGWRSVWGQGDFPFYYVQLAPYRYDGDPYSLPQIWEAQRQALTVPNTGMAVTVDVGNLHDIHPRNKQTVGHRLTLWARARTYGEQELPHSGPLYQSMEIRGSEVHLTFDHTDGGLTTRDNRPLIWFEVAGSDNIFYLAKARIENDQVIVSSEQVGSPMEVRYGWHQEAEPNLMNAAGLPASPFHTGMESE